MKTKDFSMVNHNGILMTDVIVVNDKGGVVESTPKPTSSLDEFLSDEYITLNKFCGVPLALSLGNRKKLLDDIDTYIANGGTNVGLVISDDDVDESFNKEYLFLDMKLISSDVFNRLNCSVILGETNPKLVIYVIDR